jgi:hypothetical protein
MIPPLSVSILRLTYFLSVVFLQLMLVDNSTIAMAQNFNLQNLQQQLNERSSTQIPLPDLRVGRSSQSNIRGSVHSRRAIHQHKAQEGSANH